MIKNLVNGLCIWQILDSSIVTDIIAKAGFKITLLDLEHGLLNPQTIQNCVFSSQASSIFTIARLPSCSYEYIVQIIDTGVDAVLFPHIETELDLEKIINQSLLYPKGNKSFSPFVPRNKYGMEKITVKDPSIGILIESKLGIKNSKLLISNKNVDFVYFGAYDLSVELLKQGDIFDAEIIENLKLIVKFANQFNKKVLAIYRNIEELEILFKIGVHFPVASVDTSQLALKLKEEYQNYFNLLN